MSEEWKFTLEDNQFFVNARKKPKGSVPPWSATKTHNTQTKRVPLTFVERTYSLADMEYAVRGEPKTFSSYAAVFLVAKKRIRGIDYTSVKNRQFFDDNRVREKGWHENVIYYDEESGQIVNDHRYSQLEDFSVSDLDDFKIKTANKWNIELPEEERSLFS